MGRVRRKGNFAKSKGISKRRRTRNFRKDIDQIYEDVKPENTEKYENQPVDESLPGLGQHYCISCSKYFINKIALAGHKKTKLHKKNLKNLKEKPYTQKEAEEYGK